MSHKTPPQSHRIKYPAAKLERIPQEQACDLDTQDLATAPVDAEITAGSQIEVFLACSALTSETESSCTVAMLTGILAFQGFTSPAGLVTSPTGLVTSDASVCGLLTIGSQVALPAGECMVYA